MSATPQTTSRSDRVRQRRTQPQSRAKKSTPRLSRRKKSIGRKAKAAPPTFVRRSQASAPSQNSRNGRTRRRYDLSLGMPGAELRLPSMPSIRLGWRLVSGIMVPMLVLVLWAFWNTPAYQVDQLEVTGLQRLTAQDINRLLNLHGKPIFSIDPQMIQKQLAESFPEFAKISVVVGWPNDIYIDVLERQPVIAWQRTNGLFWIDSQGVAFPPRGEVKSLPVISGELSLEQLDAQTQENMLRTDIYAQQLLSPDIVNTILQLNAFLPEGAQLLFDQEYGFGWSDPAGWEVYFGDQGTDIDARLKVYKALVKRLKKDGIQPALINLEHLHAPYYRLER